MKAPSMTLAVVLSSFLAQTTGAADLAVMMAPAARPLMLPMPGRFPQSLPARPGLGARLWALLEEWAAEPAPAPGPVFPIRESAQAALEALVIPFAAPGAPVEPGPAVAAPADRIMVTRDPEAVDVAPSFVLPPASDLFSRPVYQERMLGPWHAGQGIRFRVNHLRPSGVSWADADGFHARIRDRVLSVKARVPERYHRQFPLYYAQDEVNYEVEVENTGGLPIGGVTVDARQERFNMAGGKGPELSVGTTRLRLGDLAAGARAVVSASFFFSQGGSARINFEQTHLLVKSDGKVLADEPQAAIVDPPAP